MTRIMLLIVLVALVPCDSSRAGQRKKRKEAPSFVTIAPTRRVGAAEVYFFQDRNASRVEIPSVRIDPTGARTVDLQIAYNTPGAVPTKPTAILFAFYSNAHEQRFADDQSMYLACTAVDIDIAYPSTSVERERVGKVFREQVYVWVALDDVIAFVKCNELEVRIGSTRYIFTDIDKSAIRDLLMVAESSPAPN